MNILKLVASARRSGTTIFRRNGHGHEVHTPIGPPVTMDSMPVPFQSYHQVHRDLQSKFNTYLAGSFAFFVLTLAYVNFILFVAFFSIIVYILGML